MPPHPDRVRRNYDDICPICLTNLTSLFFNKCDSCLKNSLKLTDEEKRIWLEGSWDYHSLDKPRLKLGPIEVPKGY